MKYIPLFGKKKLLLAFEHGFVISELAKEKGVELTPEIMKRAEEIIVDSCQRNSAERIALDMIPNILSVFETKMN